MRLHSPDRGVYSTATAQQHEKGRVYFQLVESAGLVKYVSILSLYCLSYMYKFSFDSIHLSAVRARAINKSNHLSHSNFSRDGLQVSFCTFVLFTLWRVNFFLLSKLLPKLPIRLYFYTHKISNIIYILQFILHGL